MTYHFARMGLADSLVRIYVFYLVGGALLVGSIALLGAIGIPRGWAIFGGGLVAVLLAFVGLAYYVVTR